MSVLDVLLNPHLKQDLEPNTEEYLQATKELANICEQLKDEKGLSLVDQLENCVSTLEREVAKNMYKKGFYDATGLYMEVVEGK